MSRIGRLPIAIPSGVDVTVDGSVITVKGPKGTLTHTVVEPIAVERQDDGTLAVTRPDDERDSRARHGLTRTLISNMVVGVTQGYEKGLEIVGTGYRVAAKGNDLEFALGYSHPIVFPAPEGISFAVESPTTPAATASLWLSRSAWAIRTRRSATAWPSRVCNTCCGRGR